jgi:Protein of unknown function (DUF3105)
LYLLGCGHFVFAPMLVPMSENKKLPWWSPRESPFMVRRVGVLRARFLFVLSACAVVSMLVVPAVLNPGRVPAHRFDGAVTAAPTLQALAAGCGGVMTWPADPKRDGYLPDGSIFHFQGSPPAAGNYAKTPWTGSSIVTLEDAARPNLAQAVNLQYHGWVVVWYRVDAPQATVTSLLAWAHKLPKSSKVLVAPWPLDAEQTWRTGRVVIMAAWSVTQPCLTVGQTVFDQFVSVRPVAPGEHLALIDPGPEAAVVTKKGMLDVPASHTS